MSAALVGPVVDQRELRRATVSATDITTTWGPQAVLAERVAQIAIQNRDDWAALREAGTTAGNPAMRSAWQEAAHALIMAGRGNQHDLWRVVADEHGVDPFGGPVQSTLLGILAQDLITREAYATLTEPWRAIIGDKDLLSTCCLCEVCYP